MSTQELNSEIEGDTGGDDFVGGIETRQDGTDPKVETTPPDPKTQSNDELREALARLTDVVADSRKPKEEPTKPLTPEEQAERWGIFQPEKADPDFFKKWLRFDSNLPPEEQAKVLAEYKGLFEKFQHGIARQAVIGARNLFMEELAKRDEKLAVLEEHYNSTQKEGIRGRFETAYPALADRDTFSDTLKIVAGELAAQRFPDEKSYFKALAEGAAARIRRIAPSFDLQSQTTQTNRSATNTPKLPRSRVGGTGGSGGGGGGSTAVTRGANGDDASTLDWK